MMGSEQVRPVIGAVESGSIAQQAGLTAGQEIVAVDGEPTSGWAGSICNWSAVWVKAAPSL